MNFEPGKPSFSVKTRIVLIEELFEIAMQTTMYVANKSLSGGQNFVYITTAQRYFSRKSSMHLATGGLNGVGVCIFRINLSTRT